MPTFGMEAAQTKKDRWNPPALPEHEEEWFADPDDAEEDDWLYRLDA